jgi:4-amino-4-deoxy-L-arabinose transferase-like glycosyltransferase
VAPIKKSLTHRNNLPNAEIPLWLLFPLFFVAIFLSHWTLLRLPYFWDEGGYYIPAAWDFFRTGTLIPQSTATNAHPPLPSLLLAAWWHLSGYVIIGTRTFICMVSAAALLAVYKFSRKIAGTMAAVVTTLLTTLYPVWFAQSTLAHADMFAAAFTLWALSFYLDRPVLSDNTPQASGAPYRLPVLSGTLFSLAALSKETAIITPLALALWESIELRRHQHSIEMRRDHLRWLIALCVPVLPLVIWYAYHYGRTGFIFGNPEFLRYNASANLDAYRIVLSLWHRILHLTIHMNMYVPVLCAFAACLAPAKFRITLDALPCKISRPVLISLMVVLAANLIAFSELGGALLTRYLLPMYPLVLLICVSIWQRHLGRWLWLAALSAAAFLSAIWINPPYAFAPEDNLTYRDMIVLHQRAIAIIQQRFPQATVLTAWPATSELTRPELGYTHAPLRISSISIRNFSIEELNQAAVNPENFDTALIFSSKWEPQRGQLNLGKRNRSADTRYFDFHHDLPPGEAASLLHGEVVWQDHRKGEWVAVLRFPCNMDAKLLPSGSH